MFLGSLWPLFLWPLTVSSKIAASRLPGFHHLRTRVRNRRHDCHVLLLQLGHRIGSLVWKLNWKKKRTKRKIGIDFLWFVRRTKNLAYNLYRKIYLSKEKKKVDPFQISVFIAAAFIGSFIIFERFSQSANDELDAVDDSAEVHFNLKCEIRMIVCSFCKLSRLSDH